MTKLTAIGTIALHFSEKNMANYWNSEISTQNFAGTNSFKSVRRLPDVLKVILISSHEPHREIFSPYPAQTVRSLSTHNSLPNTIQSNIPYCNV